MCPADASRSELPPEEEPTYVISVAAKMVGVAAQTLRYYERQGLVEPRRSQGRIRLYSQRDVERLRRIKGLIDDLGVNLAGVEVIIRMADRMVEMEQALREMTGEMERLRKPAGGGPGQGAPGTKGNPSP